MFRLTQSGFTLVELVLVIVLIATLSAVAAQPLKHSIAYQSQLQIKEIEHALSYAQLYAMQTGCVVAVEVRPQLLNLRLLDDRCRAWTKHAGEKSSERLLIHPGTLAPYTIDVSTALALRFSESSHLYRPFGEGVLKFFPSGAACNPDGKGLATLLLEGASWERTRLQVNCATAFLEKV